MSHRLSAPAFSRRRRIVRSRYALFVYYVHRHPLMTHGGTNRRHTCIDILDDDSLLNVFYHCRPPVLLVEGDGDGIDLCGGWWECEYWWYKISWVCQRWRRLILASPFYLGISLICRCGIPLVDMLAHSPPFPLIIDHLHQLETSTAEVEERVLLALKHRDRVRRIRLRVFDTLSESVIEAIDERFPLLEYLYIQPPIARLMRPNSNLSLPSTLRAPHLRHLVLSNFTFPIGSPFLTGLVTLSLEYINPSANLGPNELLQQLSLMPHLETFTTTFHPPLSRGGVKGKFWQLPLSTRCTLPNLRWFGFEGRSAYIDALVPRIAMPLLRVTEIMSRTLNPLDLTSSILFALQSMYKTENPRPYNVKVVFDYMNIAVVIYPHQRTGMPTLRFDAACFDLDRILDFAAQIFYGIRALLTEVEILALEDRASWAQHRGLAIHTGWHKLVRSFNQVRTLHVSGGDLIEQLSRSLLQCDGESAIELTELLPMLSVLSCPEGTNVGESCRSFLTARQNAGFPVTTSYY